MGTLIEAVATKFSRARRGPFARGALPLSDAAARACLARGKRDASELDLLVNAGLYKERGMAEPALASIIQEDIGANPGGRALHRATHGHGTFSFDVMNGGCGVLTALHLLDGFVGAGTAELGLVVAADADPFPRTSRGFPFDAAAGAILVAHVDGGDEGFTSFDLTTFPEYADLFEVRLEWEPADLRNDLEVREAPTFAARCLECAVDRTKHLLSREGLRAQDLDLLIASQYPLTFAADLARAIDLPEERVPVVRPELRRAHTAGPIAALESAFRAGTFARAHRILFVTAGAGITIGTALYVRESRTQ